MSFTLSSISVSADVFDNVPFERTLILSLYTEITSSTSLDGVTSVPFRTVFKNEFNQIDLGQLDRYTGRWLFDDTVMTAYFVDEFNNPSTLKYEAGATAELSKIQSLCFKITAESTYDASQETYILYNKEILGAVDLVDVFYENVILLLPFDFKTNNNIVGVTLQSFRFSFPTYIDPKYSLCFLQKQLLQKNGKDYYQNTYIVQNNNIEIIELYWDPDNLRWFITSSIEGPLYENLNDDFENTQWALLNNAFGQIIVSVRYDEIPENLKDFTDKSKYKFEFFTPPNSTITLTNSQYKFDIGPSTGSLRCPGNFISNTNTSRDYIYLPDPTGLFNFEQFDEFTIEGWFRLGNNGLNPNKPFVLASKGTQNNPGGWVLFWRDNNLFFSCPYERNNVSAPFIPASNTWYHVAATREIVIDEEGTFGDIIRLFVNGEIIGVTENVPPYDLFTTRAANVVIGVSHDGKPFDGYLDDIRITKNVVRYKGNFTPPLEPFKQFGFDPADPLSGAVAGTYSLVYDSYPTLPNFPIIYANNENTSLFSYFYRPLPGPPHTYNVSVYPDPSIEYGSIVTTVSTENFIDQRLLSPALFTFSNLNNPTMSSVTVTVCAAEAPASIGDFYSPHLFTNTISAFFIPYPGVANFKAAPSTYFNEFAQQISIPLPLTTSPGLSFYGEGHTEYVNIIGDPSTANNYLWFVQTLDGTRIYPVTSTQSSVVAPIETEIGYYPEISISLLLTNSYIVSDGPLYYYDDSTGAKTFYPFYYSTMFDVSTVNPSNSHPFKTNITVMSYGEILSSFESGLPTSNIFLPVDSSKQFFTGSLNVNLYGQPPSASDICFDKYNKNWRWSELTSNTWNSVGPAGSQPKTWNNEGVNITNPSEKRSPIFCYGSGITWTLSTQNWVDSKTVDYSISSNISILPDYEYFLYFLSGGSVPYTTSIYENIPITVQASQLITCVISAFPFDWSPKETLLLGKETATLLSRGDFQIYTANRYVLTGTEVTYNNISPGFNNVEKIVINTQGSPNVIELTGADINNNFTVTYDITAAGLKTIAATTFYNTGYRIFDNFSGIVNVIPYYDLVSPKNYITEGSNLQLPWPNPPYIAPNEWTTEDNINTVVKQIYDNLDYLKTRGAVYRSTPAVYEGWAGIIPEIFNPCPIWTWEELDCTVPTNPRVAWTDLECINTDFPEITANKPLSSCATWETHVCIPSVQNPDCYGKYCVQWKWKNQTTAAKTQQITWKDTKQNQPYSKKWMFEPCITEENETLIGTSCDKGIWHVNIPKIDTYYPFIYNCFDLKKCNYTGIASKNNFIYVALPTEIKLLSSDRILTFISARLTIDNVYRFANIKNVCVDSQGKLYVLDGTLNKIGVFEVTPTDLEPWNLLLTWGGYGTSNSQNRFSSPNDIHIDSADNIWVCDTGNKCIKQYSNTGTWIQTLKDDVFSQNPPTSLAVDSTSNVHVLTTKNTIRVYNYTGTFLFEYNYKKFNTTKQPIRVNTNYNREIIYIVFEDQIIKHFKNGEFAGYFPQKTQCAPYYTSITQDEYRNVLITVGNNILKFYDVMQIDQRMGTIPNRYWNLQDLLIHKNEYVQDWVYNKTFQRLWDNIEIVRNSLVYEFSGCRTYHPPAYTKNNIIFGQNEIVTAATVNRNIDYLWSNFTSLLKYFDPGCFDNK